MLKREVELEPHYDDCDFARDVLQLIPNADERAKIKLLLGQFKEFEEVSKVLQVDNRDGQIGLFIIRDVFDGMFHLIILTSYKY
jgi:hypothetical protein